MKFCVVWQLQANSPDHFSGSNSGAIEERAVPALSYLLHCWAFVILVAPPEHRATCLDKMQVMLTAVGRHYSLPFGSSPF